MNRLIPLLILIPLTLACNTVTRAFGLSPTSTPFPPPTIVIPTVKAPPGTPLPTPTPFVLGLEPVKDPPQECDESPLGLPGEKLIEVAYLPSGYCFNGEIAVFENGGHVYIAQELAFEAAFRLVDVTDPAQPAVTGAWQWNTLTYTADLKFFKQGERQFLVLSLEPEATRVCGVAIVEVTDPAAPAMIGQFAGDNTGAPDDWCDVHTSQVGEDANGDGAFIYVSAIDTADLRVLDIRDLNHVREVNHYTHPEANPGSSHTFVHDSTVSGDRVYVAYWSAGLIILDRAQAEAGEPLAPLNPLDSIKPAGLQIHHTYPTADGNFVFVEDEVNYDGKQSQLRLYDIRDPARPKEALAISLESPFSSPHNLLIEGDLLYVGWYSDGVRVFRYDVSDPDKPVVEPYAFKAVRPEKTEGVFGSDIFDGIWGVRLHPCQVDGKKMRCVYASDLTRGLIILAMAP
jgi:hypothetical protein